MHTHASFWFNAVRADLLKGSLGEPEETTSLTIAQLVRRHRRQHGATQEFFAHVET